MNEKKQGPAALELTLAWPDTMVDQLAEALAARLRQSELSMPASPYLDVRAAATYLSMTADAVRKAAQRGQLPASQPLGPGTRYIFDRRELDALIAAGRLEPSRDDQEAGR
jgi:hypothetical protein